MNKQDILSVSSMPLVGSSYPKGPYRFINREYLIVSYETDRDALRAAVPEPLEPESNIVNFEFMKMPDSSGFGDYTESGLVIPCLYKGTSVNFTLMMYLDDEPPITAGREIWGFPKKIGHPKLEVIHDTLTGTLHYADQLVATGTMTYKHENLLNDPEQIKKQLGKQQVVLKLIPHVDGSVAIAQLVTFAMTDIAIKGAWGGQARLGLNPHVNAPVADFPVRKVIGGSHFIADMTLPYGTVLYDYLKN
jgi:acetoacetate decarboxylase